MIRGTANVTSDKGSHCTKQSEPNLSHSPQQTIMTMITDILFTFIRFYVCRHGIYDTDDINCEFQEKSDCQSSLPETRKEMNTVTINKVFLPL